MPLDIDQPENKAVENNRDTVEKNASAKFSNEFLDSVESKPNDKITLNDDSLPPLEIVDPDKPDLVAEAKPVDKAEKVDEDENQTEKKVDAEPKSRTKEEMSVLVRQLGSPDFSMRNNASRELQKAGAEALPNLKEGLRDSSLEVRKRAERLVDERLKEYPGSIDDFTSRGIGEPGTILNGIPTALKKDLTPKEKDAASQELRGLIDIMEDKDGSYGLGRGDRRGNVLDSLRGQLEDISNPDATKERLEKVTELDLYRRSNTTDADLSGLNKLKNLTFLNLSGTQVTDKGIAELNTPKLKQLHVSETQITDKGLEHIGEKFPQLQDLGLRRTNVTDEGLSSLSDSKKLTFLDVTDNPNVSDFGLEPLKNLPNLGAMRIEGSNITQLGIIHFNVGRKTQVSTELFGR